MQADTSGFITTQYIVYQRYLDEGCVRSFFK